MVTPRANALASTCNVRTSGPTAAGHALLIYAIVRPMAHPGLKVFDTLPAKERWFCHARLKLAPLEQVAEEASGKRLLDVGCGHGVLAALLLEGHPERHVVGIDPDERKIEWANDSIGKRPNAEFRAMTIEALAAERPGSFDCVIIADVLCLIARETWPPFLAAARRLLRPGGRLVLKDAENDGSWRAIKALWQERLMVHVLRRTVSTGGIGFATREELAGYLTDAGFLVDDITSYAKGYTAPHVLLTAHVP
jgi:2-polyprenyl-3-methyl-5-hydroxy-6-metoxy-1,4-benzoquinol methylase